MWVVVWLGNGAGVILGECVYWGPRLKTPGGRLLCVLSDCVVYQCRHLKYESLHSHGISVKTYQLVFTVLFYSQVGGIAFSVRREHVTM